MKTKAPNIKRLKELLDYDPLTGRVTTKKGRLLVPDDDGLVVVFDNLAVKRSVRYKLDRIAYALAFNKYPTVEQKVLHKNLDPTDNSMKNLTVVAKLTYRLINEARRNIEGGIKITPHPTDQFCYVLSWYSNNKEVQKTISDIGVARLEQLKLQLKYSKILTRHCVFD